MDERLRLTVPEGEIDGMTQDQIQRALELPYLKTLAIMPDVHAGYDLPIGGVALLDGHIWPGAVGYDIGCGMCHVNTGMPSTDFPAWETIFERIMKVVPVGFATLQSPDNGFERFPNATGYAAVADAVNHKASIQLGTLGSGNHFIEIGISERDGNVGVTIHSGSRRPGWLLGDFHMKKTGGPVPLDSEDGQNYLTDMTWALDFALKNRLIMMRRCLQVMGLDESLLDGVINENHNHATVTPDGVLHRKGATPAEAGQLGIIPANMRDGTYITRGLGNAEFLASASHGAGRSMSRNQARKSITLETLHAQMTGIVAPPLGKLIDEAPEAYKDISGVIAAQDGVLVDVIDHLKPVLVVKG